MRGRWSAEPTVAYGAVDRRRLPQSGRELRSVVRADVDRHPAVNEQLGKTRQYVLRVEAPRHVNCQALARVLVDDRQQAQLPPIRRAVEHEVVGPDVVAVLGTPTHDRAVGKPEPATLRLLRRHLQPLLPPEPFHSLVVHPPTLLPEQRRHPPVAVAAEAGSQRHQPCDQCSLIRGLAGNVALRRPCLSDDATGASFRDLLCCPYVCHRPTSFRRAQKLPWATSRRIELSSAWSATRRLSRAFSRSSSFQPLRLVDPHPAILAPPAVVGLLADPQLPRRLADGLPLGQVDRGLA